MNILSRLSFCALCLFMPTLAISATWTLDSCINYALKHNLNVLSSEANIESSELAVTQARSRYLPTISANASQSWNLGRGLTAQNTYANRSTSSFNWGVSGSISIFDGLATPRRVEYAKANLNQVIERYEAAKEDITINIITAYLQVLYTRELTEVAERQVQLSELELTKRDNLLEAGKIPEIDILEAKSQLSSDKASLVQAQNNLTMALVDLAKLLRINDLSSFDIAPLADADQLIMKPDEAYRLASQYNHNIKAARMGVESSEANISVSESGYLPTLSFGSSIGSTYYNVSGMPNEKFGSQMKNNYSTYFGFQLNIPIFDAFNTRNSIRQAKADKALAELQLSQAEDDLLRTINDVYYQAVGAYNKYESAQVAEQYALAAFEAMQEKYNLGRATPNEYEQSNAKALNATAERIQAHYELILRTRLLNYYASPH